MRFYINLRDLSSLVDLFFDSPARGTLILCLAVVFCIVFVITVHANNRK